MLVTETRPQQKLKRKLLCMLDEIHNFNRGRTYASHLSPTTFGLHWQIPVVWSHGMSTSTTPITDRISSYNMAVKLFDC